MILVTGATGNIGREVVNLLLDSGEKVAAVTRNPATAALPDGAHVVGGDPSRPQTLTSALRGVEAVFVSPRALGDVTAGAATAELLKLAAEQGAQRVVALTSEAVEFGGRHKYFADAFIAVEEAAKASGLPWTILRCAEFASNNLMWAPQIRSTGKVKGAYGDAANSTIHERDIAAVSARALVDAAHAGHTYVLTGPQSLSQRDKVRLIGEAIGKQVLWEEISPQQVREAMLAQGIPEHSLDRVDRLHEYLASLAQHPEPSTTTVEQVLGRPALTFIEWAVEHAAVFRN
jgi:uncharacterized protein YbjT (DUF2867 family)